MKMSKYFLIAISAVSLLACSSDDDAQPLVTNNPPAAVTALLGEYRLSILIVPTEVDYNQDGTASFNIMDESPCYQDTNIILFDDMTFTATDSSVFFASETGCQSDDKIGTWQVVDELLVLSTVTSNELTYDTEYSVSGNELTTGFNGTYPTRDAEGNPELLSGGLQATYTKIN